MPNYISVTQVGPDVTKPLRDAIQSPMGQRVVGDIRKAGAILQRNPLGTLMSELIFPHATADGTMDARSKIY